MKDKMKGLWIPFYSFGGSGFLGYIMSGMFLFYDYPLYYILLALIFAVLNVIVILSFAQAEGS